MHERALFRGFTVKKFLLTVLTLIFIASALPLFGGVSARAAESPDSGITTGIFLPTSYLQYYKLDDPFAICRYKDDDEEFVAISHKKGLVIYKNEKFAKIDLDLSETAVTVLQRYENYLFFLYESVVRYIDITDFETEGWIAEARVMRESEGDKLYSSFSFSICGNEIVCHTSDNIKKYKLTTDLSGELVAEHIASIDRTKTSMLHLSKNGSVYFSTSDQNGIYVWKEGGIAQFDNSAENVRAITENEYGDTVYYSCEKGIYSINTATASKSPVVESTEFTHEADLGGIYSPQGVCLLGDSLWVVDNGINAVQEIDLLTGKFTDFAITTNSSAVNRLSDKVKDITVDKDKIYALDEGRIVVVNGINNVERTYNRINLSVPVDKFSVGSGYLCYSSGKTVNLCKITPSDEDENLLDITENVSTTLVDTGEVIDIAFSEGIFYVISTTVLEDNLPHPVVYSVDVTADELLLEKVIDRQTAPGTAKQITADVFGTIYYCSLNGSYYEFYSFDGNEVVKLAERVSSTDLKNLQTDFDGKLYSLYDGNVIEIIDGGEITAKTLKTSENLGSINPAKSMCLSCNSDTAYFIFEGLILKSTLPEELNIATPHTIDIPEDFSTAYDDGQAFANVKEGAKLFEIDITKLSGEHFVFLEYSEADSNLTDYAVKRLNDKYSVLIKEDVAAVARNTDIEKTFTAENLEANMFAVVEFSTYSLPVLEKHYINDHTVEKFKTVKITGKITFNGICYYTVSIDGVKGFIPDTFFVDSIIAEDGSATVIDAYVYDKAGVEVYDADGNVIGKFDKKTKVTVLSVGVDKLAIIYGDTVGYVGLEFIVTNSRTDVMKSIAIFLASLSVLVTSLYFEKRYLFRR